MPGSMTRWRTQAIVSTMLGDGIALPHAASLLAKPWSIPSLRRMVSPGVMETAPIIFLLAISKSEYEEAMAIYDILSLSCAKACPCCCHPAEFKAGHAVSMKFKAVAKVQKVNASAVFERPDYQQINWTDWCILIAAAAPSIDQCGWIFSGDANLRQTLPSWYVNQDPTHFPLRVVKFVELITGQTQISLRGIRRDAALYAGSPSTFCGCRIAAGKVITAP